METLTLSLYSCSIVAGLIALAVVPWLIWAWRLGLWRRVPVSGGESKTDTRRVIAELEPLVNRYGAFLDANAHLIYGIPASMLDTTPQELKAMLLRYGSALRDSHLLDERARQILRSVYCELARVLPDDECNDAVAAAEVSMRGLQANDDNWPLIHKASANFDSIAAEYSRLMQEFDSHLPPRTV
jgi:hypothetical protein